MADSPLYFFNNTTFGGAATTNSVAIPTKDLRDLSVYLFLPAPSGAGTDTLDVVVQESDEQDFSTASRIFTAATFTQVLGNTTGALLKQKINLTDKNYNRYLRAVVTTVGSASIFATTSIMIAANKKV